MAFKYSFAHFLCLERNFQITSCVLVSTITGMVSPFFFLPFVWRSVRATFTEKPFSCQSSWVSCQGNLNEKGERREERETPEIFTELIRLRRWLLMSFGAFPNPSNLLCLSQSLWRTSTVVPTITWASWGLPSFKAKTQEVLHPAANQQWHLLTADLPFGAPSWPLSWPSCSYANIFLAANPETDLSHITGYLHQKDEIRHSKCLKLVEMRKKGVFACSFLSGPLFCFIWVHMRNTSNLPQWYLASLHELSWPFLAVVLLFAETLVSRRPQCVVWDH